MTAPTPALSEEEWSEFKKVGREAEDERAWIDRKLASALAAVTAERDQAIEALAATNKLGAFETGKTIGAAEVRKELDQARQMLADEVKSLRIMRDNSDRRATECVQAMQSLDTENRQLHAVLADAPHDKTCGSHPMNGVRDLGCSCWKAGL
jgi:hypothetical protein